MPESSSNRSPPEMHWKLLARLEPQRWGAVRHPSGIHPGIRSAHAPPPPTPAPTQPSLNARCSPKALGFHTSTTWSSPPPTRSVRRFTFSIPPLRPASLPVHCLFAIPAIWAAIYVWLAIDTRLLSARSRPQTLHAAALPTCSDAPNEPSTHPSRPLYADLSASSIPSAAAVSSHQTTIYTPAMPSATPVQGIVSSTSDCIPAEPKAPSIAPSLTYSDESDDQEELVRVDHTRRRRASTRLIAQNARDIQRITGETTAEFVGRCCGGGCCLMGGSRRTGIDYEPVHEPTNEAYQSLGLHINEIPTSLTGITELPEKTVSFKSIPQPRNMPSPTDSAISLGSDRDSTHTAGTVQEKQASSHGLGSVDTSIQPPRFVQPHPPYHVYPARIHTSRELTKVGAEKRTYHFDLDITDYPVEDGTDFKVGGAIGVMAPNCDIVVDDVLDALMVPRFQRDKPVLLVTSKGRWPTVWGDDQPRELVTTRRDLLTWCTDLQSYPPTKPLLRVLAEHASEENEKKILTFLCSAEGQGAFCDFRTGPHMTISQLLNAFPSSQPPLDELLSCLQPLMPRFYSLSNDPHESYQMRDQKQHRLIEIAVTVHETNDWKRGCRTGVGSGYFERQAQRFLKAQKAGQKNPEFYIPMFKGLMANPLAKQFNSEGPMLLIGAGVGIAPFRGFVQRRLKQANCANKVWVLQGVRDSLLDEIYSGEWGVHEDEVKRVVQSRRGEGKYVQEEVRNQADLVWYIINAVDGRVFVCGSSKGMGEGVEEALIDVAMAKGNLEREEAGNFWQLKKEAGQYIAETW
ncbi:hypothetical protein Purlil1_7202 [Purpureocillium lilacinum]|uniref:FAD-binding FR-type domain-containing protein n=1 Tax=Purpureocillium lilacinum TaxID=33203 RepID=A0ABR0BXZ0_PURLI|nr:hypothetical protein Purlil1_7202 [Purpureocillium lilacinum]